MSSRENKLSHRNCLATSSEAVHRIVDAHTSTHRRFPESARLRDLGAERALVQDYSGRVVFELLQNAIDRAECEIVVRWNSASCILEVANDGIGITVESGPHGPSDLTALLTLHTSSKSARDSVGNKGVGFRSVFASSSVVEVSSQALNGEWWGLRLHHPARLEPEDQSWSKEDVASFYAPEPCKANENPAHCTVIRLLDVRNPEVVGESVKELQEGPLTFLERRAAPGLCIRIYLDAVEVSHVIGANRDVFTRERSAPLTDGVRRSTGLDLDKGEVRVLWQANGAGTPRASRYWSYLPTEQPAGFGVQVHGDFYLSNSRRNLALRRLRNGDNGEDPAGWNARLVELAADCVAELWLDPTVCSSEEFWRQATPSACECPHLRLAVARRVWADGATLFKQMSRASFPDGILWPLQRYRDYFDAISAWADFAFRHQPEFGGRARYLRVRELLARAEASEAPVLPIVATDTQDLEVLSTRPVDARPLVAGQQGQRRAVDADRIYQLRFDPERKVELPQAIRKQHTFVTTFNPNVDDNLATQGLLPFDRLEILAQLKPGHVPGEHAELLRAAIELAQQEPRGGLGSLVQRARSSEGGSAWRFVKATESVNRAGVGLAQLLIPTLGDGWSRAADCGLTRGPWPVVDLPRLAGVLGVSPEQECRTADDALLLLGVTPVPLGTSGTLELAPTLAPETGEDLIREWPRFGRFLDLEVGRKLRGTLNDSRWVRPFDGLQLAHGPEGDESPYRPLDLWHQQPGRGFKTELLPRIVLDDERRPDWIQQLEVESPTSGANSCARLSAGLDRLRRLDPQVMYDKQRDLIEVYRALVTSLLAQGDPSTIPLLVRPIDSEGRQEPARWAKAEEFVWHEPDGANREALQSFTGVLHWVVRKQAERRLVKLGLKNFRVDRPKVKHRGASSVALAESLRDRLTVALPDLLAASMTFHLEFDVGEALQRFSAMTVQHFDDIWIEWEFDGKVGSVGADESGDVFLSVRDDGGMELCFDGEHAPLVRCACPLSELMASNRAFGTLYKDALHAWAAHSRDSGASVSRFRREHGLGEREVAEMRDRVQGSIMGSEERDVWMFELSGILSSFGCLNSPLELGMVIRPQTFASGRPVHEDEVKTAVRGLQRLWPHVDFFNPHGIELDKIERGPLLAEMAERNRGEWTEASLVAWKERLETPLPDEDEARRHLVFDAVGALRRRLGLPEHAIAYGNDAMSFAKGQIPLRSLPVEHAAEVVLRRFAADSADSHARDAQTDDDFIRQARRRAQGGKRAEDAVLDLAVSQALTWQRTDKAGFGAAFERVASLFETGDDNPARKRFDGAVTTSQMRRFLHVAEYVGNVGFDVLVPDSGRLLLVEVKRVSELRGAAFFLSENERRRALRHREAGLDWRLWLVAGNGESLDASSIIEPFGRHRAPLAAMANDGLRPGEWFFVLG